MMRNNKTRVQSKSSTLRAAIDPEFLTSAYPQGILLEDTSWLTLHLFPKTKVLRLSVEIVDLAKF